MKIITGHTGENHVTSHDDRALHAGIFGSGSYVLDTGERLGASVITSNTIRISEGDIMHQGAHARIPHGEYEDVTIDNGTTGYRRKDLIMACYLNAGGIEAMTLEVRKGIPDASDPLEPACLGGNILEGDSRSEMPLYIVELDGVNIVGVVPKFKVLHSINETYTKEETYAKSETYKKDETYSKAETDSLLSQERRDLNVKITAIGNSLTDLEGSLNGLKNTTFEEFTGIKQRLAALEDAVAAIKR